MPIRCWLSVFVLYSLNVKKLVLLTKTFQTHKTKIVNTLLATYDPASVGSKVRLG